MAPRSRQLFGGREDNGGAKGTPLLSLKSVASSCFMTLPPTPHGLEVSVWLCLTIQGDTDLILDGHILSLKWMKGMRIAVRGRLVICHQGRGLRPLTFSTLPQTWNICSHLMDIQYTLTLPIIGKVFFKKNIHHNLKARTKHHILKSARVMISSPGERWYRLPSFTKNIFLGATMEGWGHRSASQMVSFLTFHFH